MFPDLIFKTKSVKTIHAQYGVKLLHSMSTCKLVSHVTQVIIKRIIRK